MPTIEERLDSLESRFGKNDEMVRGLRENYTVIVEIETRQSRLLREHSEIMAQHELAIARDRENREKASAEHDRRMAELDQRIATLVSAVGEFIRRQPSGA